MSILLQALSKQANHDAHTVGVAPSVQQGSTRGSLWLAIVIICVLLCAVFLYPEAPKKSEIPRPESSPKMESPPPESLVEMARSKPESILMRLQTAPETVQASRDSVMQALLEVQAWHVAYTVARAFPMTNPSLAERHMLAVYALEHEQYDEACAHYEQITSEDPERKDAWVGLGICSMNIGAYRRALQAYEHALSGMHEDDLAYTFVLEQLDRLSERGLDQRVRP